MINAVISSLADGSGDINLVLKEAFEVGDTVSDIASKIGGYDPSVMSIMVADFQNKTLGGFPEAITNLDDEYQFTILLIANDLINKV